MPKRALLFWIAVLVTVFGTALVPISSRAENPGPDSQLDPVPPDHAAKLDEARGLISQKKWLEAVPAYRAFLKETPPGPLAREATIDLSTALMYSGQRTDALALLAQAISREANDVLVRRLRVMSKQFLTSGAFQRFQEGTDLQFNRKYKAAREKFERVLEEEPDNIEILTRIGQCLVMEGDFDRAAERLRQARKLNPFEPETQLWLGRALFHRGEMKEAVDELEKAKLEIPQSELVHVWLAEAHVASGLRQRGIEVLEQNLKERPLHLSSLLSLARLKYQSFLATPGGEPQQIATLTTLRGQASKEPQKDKKLLWSARQDLQLILSRMSQYEAPGLRRFESELGLELRDPSQLKLDTEALLKRVEEKLQAVQQMAPPTSAGSAS